MAIGIGIGNIFRRVTGLIPDKSDALFILDGTILNSSGTYYFVDKSGNNRNFLITGYDFSSTIDKGFPYKSAATISAPVGDSTLIAADVNNYLYDSGGNPNQLPVISLFQDIDYEHKIFSRHAVQKLDSNGVEIYEPRVLDFVMYNSVRTGSKLNSCNSYYKVPTEITTNVKWVAKNGSDANAGTKASRYLTINRAIAQSSNGYTIYVTSGNYLEVNSTYNVMIQKGLTIINIGNSKISGAGSTSNAVVRIDTIQPVTIKNFTIDGLGTHGVGIGTEHSDKYINKCKIINVTTYSANIKNGFTLTNCIFTSKTLLISQGTNIIDTCYFGNAHDYFYYVNSSASVLTIKNSLLKTNSSNTYPQFFNLINTLNYLGNSLYIDNVCLPFYIPSTTTSIYNIKYNKITVSANLTQEVIRQHSTGNTFDIQYNTIINNNLVSDKAIVMIADSFQPIISNNIIISKSINTSSLINVKSNGTLVGKAIIENNYLKTSNSNNYVINVGAEGTGISDEKLNGTEISKNHIVCVNGGLTIHAIFIGCQKNCKIFYNKVENAGIAIVLKSSGMIMNSEVKYNLIKNSAQGFRLKGVKNCSVINNIYYNDSGDSYYALLITNNDGINQSANNIIKNNIFAATQVLQFSLINNLDTVDYNLHFSATNNFIYDYNGVDYYSFLDYKTATNYDSNGINQDPQLTDFIPSQSSPALNLCAPLAADYNTGLDSTTNWGNDSQLPAIVSKEQTGSLWDAGAYVININE